MDFFRVYVLSNIIVFPLVVLIGEGCTSAERKALLDSTKVEVRIVPNTKGTVVREVHEVPQGNLFKRHVPVQKECEERDYDGNCL